MQDTTFNPFPNPIILEISCSNRAAQYLEIRYSVGALPAGSHTFHQALWRPGRYSAAHYGQYLRGMRAFTLGPEGQKKEICIAKTSKNSWELHLEVETELTLTYAYHAAVLDAGSCWVDENLFYLNFAPLLLWHADLEELPYVLQLPVRAEEKVATALKEVDAEKGRWEAKDYQQLIDSPVLISKKLQSYSYIEGETTFYLHLYGPEQTPSSDLLSTFQAFTARQVHDFGSFPVRNYHFIILLLPFPKYHGVEHQASTVITLGPQEQLKSPAGQELLAGISSHELYHAWNVCSIRPAALRPYRLHQEVHLREGLFLEGVTTYMGDLYLKKSGFLSADAYLDTLARRFEKQGLSAGWRYQSIAQASEDLWLDGYTEGSPDRKINIYLYGSLLALGLDLLLLEAGESLPLFMRQLWETYGHPEKGYVYADLLAALRAKSPELDTYVASYIEKAGQNVIPFLLQQLDRSMGIYFQPVPAVDPLLRLGIHATAEGHVRYLHPDSEAYARLRIGDQVQLLSEQGPHEIQVQRWGNSFLIPLAPADFFPRYTHFRSEGAFPLRAAWWE
ncbi:MAG: M61 family metallopeptidase [Nitritalea sp.]